MLFKNSKYQNKNLKICYGCELVKAKIFIIVILILSFSVTANACKDIVAVGDATAGDYNLLLKVRDPSRPGYQVLFIIERGYEYDYHHPWTGREMHFEVENKFIGVATKDDVPPNIVKPGMALSDAGIAYGDADIPMIWLNPTRNGWDDFDWIRYACQKAANEDEACKLMTQDVVEKMHAPSVGENLFICGPKKAFLIEADAFHYDVIEVKDLVVRSNYPKALWRKSPYILIAPHFDSSFDGFVSKGRIARIGLCLQGVEIKDIGNDWIVAKLFPFGEEVKIFIGETRNVGNFGVKLLECSGRKAHITMHYEYFEWESKIMNLLPYGSITVKDMMNLSRLHSDDLDGMRGMCEGGYEASMIFKIPYEHPEIMSSGWFAPNQCSSIYIPVHICVHDIYDPYENGEAHILASKLLDRYGHGNLIDVFAKPENVFLLENEVIEGIASGLDEKNVSDLLTLSDMKMQLLALLTEEIWLDMAKIKDEGLFNDLSDVINNAWRDDYSTSLKGMREAVIEIKNMEANEKLDDILHKLLAIASNISYSRIKEAELVGKDISPALKKYEKGINLIKKGNYEKGVDNLNDAFEYADCLLMNRPLKIEEKNEGIESHLIFISIVVAAVIAALIIKKIRF